MAGDLVKVFYSKSNISGEIAGGELEFMINDFIEKEMPVILNISTGITISQTNTGLIYSISAIILYQKNKD